ncbi:hypothetical protein [Alloyangia pacifica]|nr:hypothetical protein [Alloyangia pacifica]MCA0998639.1 hypothetical protein [Alloyangia pacifica]
MAPKFGTSGLRGLVVELRLYVEASDRAGAEELMATGLAELRSAVLG